jgi:hypothetical protein
VYCIHRGYTQVIHKVKGRPYSGISRSIQTESIPNEKENRKERKRFIFYTTIGIKCHSHTLKALKVVIGEEPQPSTNGMRFSSSMGMCFICSVTATQAAFHMQFALSQKALSDKEFHSFSNEAFLQMSVMKP